MTSTSLDGLKTLNNIKQCLTATHYIYTDTCIFVWNTSPQIVPVKLRLLQFLENSYSLFNTCNTTPACWRQFRSLKSRTSFWRAKLRCSWWTFPGGTRCGALSGEFQASNRDVWKIAITISILPLQCRMLSRDDLTNPTELYVWRIYCYPVINVELPALKGEYSTTSWIEIASLVIYQSYLVVTSRYKVYQTMLSAYVFIYVHICVYIYIYITTCTIMDKSSYKTLMFVKKSYEMLHFQCGQFGQLSSWLQRDLAGKSMEMPGKCSILNGKSPINGDV